MLKKRITYFLFNVFTCSVFINNTNCVKWDDFMEIAQSGTKELAELIEPFIVENFPFENVSTQCTNSLILYADGIKTWKPWAIKMFDATGKFPSVFLRATLTDFGSFDQCLGINVNFRNESVDFKGKFCMLHLKSHLFSPVKKKQADGKSYIEAYGYPPDWVNETVKMMEHDMMKFFGLYLGICVPSTCSDQDLDHIFTSLTKVVELQASLTDCQVSEAKKWPTSSKIAMAVLAGLIGLVILGTVTDLLEEDIIEKNKMSHSKSVMRKYLKAFSVRSNCQVLFEINDKVSSLDFMYGLKVVLCIWMIYLHVIGYPTLWMARRTKNFLNLFDLPPFAIVLDNGLVVTEYIMFIGGFFVSYSMSKKSLKVKEKKKKMNFFYAIFLKYLRYTPPLILLLIITFALPLLHDGPIWNSVWERRKDICRKYFWLNLLYANNFGSFEDVCWNHTWFISTMMQLQIFCVGLFFFTKKFPRIGVTLGVLISFGCIIHDFNVSVKNKYAFPTYGVWKSPDIVTEYISKIYIRPYHHFIVYMTGMILGGLNLKDYKPKKVHVIIGWILNIVSSLCLFYSVWLPTKNVHIMAFHNSCRNVLLCFQMTIFILLCVTKSAGLLGKFLEWKAWVPLSKMMFSINLLHPVLIVTAEAIMRERITDSPISIIIQGSALLIASVIFGAFIYFLVEAPFYKICDLLEGKGDANYLKNYQISKNNGEGYSENTEVNKKKSL